MPLSIRATGQTILAADHNEVYNLLKGVSGNGEGITLIYNAAGAVILQPSTDPSSGTQLIQIKNAAGTTKAALTSDGWFLNSTNNGNIILGTDPYASSQNVAYMDGDGNTVFGPSSDMRLQNQFPMPIHREGGHWFDGFLGSALRTEWTQTVIGAGTTTIPGSLATQMGEVDLATGTATAGDGVELSLRGANIKNAGSGARLWVVGFARNTQQQQIEIGFKDTAATTYVRWRLTEAGAAAAWQCECAGGGAATTTSSAVTNTGVNRYTFAIDLATAGTAVFYLSDGTGGAMQSKVTINTNMPAAGTVMFPYMKIISNGAAVNKTFSGDHFYLRRTA